MCVTIQLQAPDFSLECINGESLSQENMTLSAYAGHWLTLVFYPRDFSLVAASELRDLNAHHEDFQKCECRVLALSVDAIPLHRKWLETHHVAGGLGPLKFSLGSDPSGRIAQAFGVWNRERRNSESALFVIDPNAVVQHVAIHNPKVGRSAADLLRVLDALQTTGLCPATWVSGDDPISLSEALQASHVFGRYQIQRQLGSGTFGKVFVGEDLYQGRELAVKILKSEARLGKGELADVQSTLKLSHPNICTVHSVDESDGVVSIASELLSGQPLGDLLNNSLSSERVRRLAGQMASALASAHDENVVHGDLKPTNIRVLSHDVVKIKDFGIARACRRRTPEGNTISQDDSFNFEESEDGDDTTMIQLKHVAHSETSSSDSQNTLLENDGRAFGLVGTPGYMAPEQSQGISATQKSDTFSLGILLFEMLTGTRAFSVKNLVMMVMDLQDESLSRELSAKVPAAFQPLLSRMLAIDPEDRPTMKKVTEQLQQFV